MKKAHLRRRLSSEGASTAPFRTSPQEVAPAKPALESPPCIWTFLISLHSEGLVPA